MIETNVDINQFFKTGKIEDYLHSKKNIVTKRKLESAYLDIED